MNADRIKILHAANSDAVVIPVSDNLELNFLPSGNAALDEYLSDHRVVQPLDHCGDQLFFIFCDTASCASHRIRRAYNDGVTDAFCKRNCCMHILDNRALWNRLAELLHRLLEALAILRLLDCFERSTEQFHTVCCQNPLLGKLNRKVQPCLSAECRQESVRLLLGDDLLKKLHGQRFDVDTICNVCIRHDGRGVAVHEHNLKTILFQCTARL